MSVRLATNVPVMQNVSTQLDRMSADAIRDSKCPTKLTAKYVEVTK
jgi:hypothetical protein